MINRLKYSSTSKIIINLIFFFSLQPYISIIPLGSDVQPIVGVFAFLLLLILFVNIKIQFSFRELYFLFLCIIIIIPFAIVPSSYEFRKRIGLLFSFIIYYSISRCKNDINPNIIYYSFILHFIAAFFQVLSPEFFKSTIGILLRDVKSSGLVGARGISGLATEPSFLAYLMLYHILLVSIFKDFFLNNKMKKRIIIFFSIIIILLTKSGTAYVISLLLLSIFLINKIRQKIIFFLLIIIGFLILNLIPVEKINFRGLSILVTLAQNPQIIFLDASIGSRINQILIGVLAFITYPIGNGGGTFLYIAPKIYEKYNLSKIYIFPSARERIEYEMNSGAISTFSQYSIELGILYIILLIMLFTDIDYKRKDIGMIVTYIIVAILAGFPIVFPPVWVLFALIKNDSINKTINQVRLK